MRNKLKSGLYPLFFIFIGGDSMNNYTNGVSPINNLFSMDNHQTLSYNRDIIWKVNLDTGESITIARCYGTVVTGKSISINIELLRPDVFTQYQQDLQATIDGWVTEVKELAIKNGVPFVQL